MNKGASIITNFGCDVGCSYCIWKNHPLKTHYTTIQSTDWTKLHDFIQPYDKISVSGGGDPFYNYKDNINWFDKLFSIYSGKIDVHTAKIIHINDLRRFNKIVVHFNFDRFIKTKESFKEIPNPKRAVFVITSDLFKNKIDKIVTETQQLNCQLSFRELYNSNGTEDIQTYIKELQSIHNYIRLIKQADYNKYFMSDNTIRSEFI
jgi:adenine C2-methylase RlmN of 23S rRNA A2503 and tRNA A37